MSEATFQSSVTKWLRSQGCWVMKTRPGMGTPVGTADIFFCKEGFYGWIEAKASKTAPIRPGQREFIAKMAEWSWAKIAFPENWESVKKELLLLLV